ncbi:MAG: ABC transporter substrate-binding protein [Candidatus Bathyarchaeia archaeon]
MVSKKALIAIIVVIVVIVAAVVAFYIVPAFVARPAEQILIGATLDLTGPMAAFNAGLTFGHQAAVEDINAQGGVLVGGRRIPVKYIVYNNEGDPSKAASQAADLILKEGVIALVGGDGPPVIWNPICVEADRYKTPIVAGSPWEPWWAGGPAGKTAPGFPVAGGYNYAWSILFRIAVRPGSETGHPWLEGKRGYRLADAAVDITKMFEKYYTEKPPRVAVLACDDADGRGWYETFPKVVKEELGYIPWRTPEHTGETFGLYPPGTTDFTSLIEEWKRSNCEILWANLPGIDFGTVVKQMAALGYTPKIGWIARGAMFYEEIAAWGGDLPLGWISEIKWDPTYDPAAHPGIGGTTPWSLHERWSKAKGTPVEVTQYCYTTGFGYAAMQVLFDAISRAGKIDKEAINNAIAETDMYTIVGHIKFSKLTHDSPCPVVVGQWQKVDKPWKWEMRIVYSPIPEIKPNGEMIFPIPPK